MAVCSNKAMHQHTANKLYSRSGCLGLARSAHLRVPPVQRGQDTVRRAYPNEHMTSPARPVALPNGMWLLDIYEDQFYNIMGPDFVIQRAEATAPASTQKKPRRVKGPIARMSKSMGLVHKAVWHHPSHIMLLEGGVVDVSDYLEACPVAEEGTEAAQQERAPEHMVPNTSCTGIVMVQQTLQEEDEDAEVVEQQDVFYTTSSSTRRTKMVGFTCKCCGARNFNSVNPQSFLRGTLVAQCGKCSRWHKISDHFKLFHDLKGPLFRAVPGAELQDVVPSSLPPLDPALWEDDGGFQAGDRN